jgi:diguanylate cyclase (GGDEF)-like protein/PAS domain S-box-containing protein
VVQSRRQLAAAAVPDAGDRAEIWMRNLLENPSDRVFFKDRESRFLMVSRGWLEHSGHGRTLAEVIGRTDFDMFGEEHAAAAFADEQRILATGDPLVGKLERETYRDRPDVLVSTTKLPLRDAEGRIIGTYGISRDVTAEVTREALAHHSLHDPVTGLPNRAALVDDLGRALAGLGESPRGRRLAVIAIDLDGFREINATFGHELGDQLLFEVGARLRRAARHSDTVARFGADRFVVLCPSLRSDNDPRRPAERLRAAFDLPVLGERHLSVTASLGVAHTADPLVDPGDLLARADAAVRHAKRRGGDRCELYAADADAHPDPVDELRGAIERDELGLLYQPVVRLEDRALVGVEALVRWNHPTRGLLGPAEFIPPAERDGLITELDARVLQLACAQLATWNHDDPRWRERTVAVNLSGRSLHDPRLPATVERALTRHRLAPGQLCLEITETSLIGTLDEARRITARLAELGVRIALDDFGTGFSTLAHLQQLRPHVLKIDRSFIARLGQEPRDREIVAAVTAMAQALGMTVVAEGVETRAQLDILRSLHCEEAQGFLFARPLAPERCADFAAGG